MAASFLELYNEEIRDLLREGTALKSLVIRKDAVSGQLNVLGLRSVQCSSPQQLLHCLREGAHRRTTGALYLGGLWN